MVERRAKGRRGRAVPWALAHRWILIAVVYSAIVVAGNLAIGPSQSLTGLLAITPVLVSFHWDWRGTAAWSVLPLIVAGTDLFGYDTEPST